MKTILCFGDSNTWGARPDGGLRYPKEVRWPSVLQAALGNAYEVIAEGLPGRTTVFEDPIEEQRNGKMHLIPCLYSHRPLDLVIILLGTNDMKQRFGVSAIDSALGAGVLVEMVQKSTAGPDGRAPKVLLLAPPPVLPIEATDQPAFLDILAGAQTRSQHFAACFRYVAEQRQCGFFDTATVIQSSPRDGVHLEPEAHAALGNALAAQVRRIIP
jgi:lysophospholipase L1-like esterase